MAAMMGGAGRLRTWYLPDRGEVAQVLRRHARLAAVEARRAENRSDREREPEPGGVRIMIAEGTPIAFIPCRDPAASRSFYEETLGLELIGEDEFALMFDAGGTPLRLTRVAGHSPPPYTVFGWEVEKMDEAVAELEERGVELARFEGVPQDERGVWTAPDGTRVVWFRDPDGNVLSITEFGA